MGWFILACICGGGIWGMSRAELNRNQERRHQEQMDAIYDAGGSNDYEDSSSSDCSSGGSED